MSLMTTDVTLPSESLTIPKKTAADRNLGGVNYNLFFQSFGDENELDKKLEELIKRTHDKKHAKIKPPSLWIKPDAAMKEYALQVLPENLVWYKKDSPIRRAILRSSLEGAIKKGERVRV